VEGLSTVLAMELSGNKLDVISVHPGVINTPIVRDPKAVAASMAGSQIDGLQHYYATKGCEPSVVAKAIVAAVLTGKDKVFVGPKAKISALMRRFAPARLARSLTLANAREIGFWK
jgi:short-subunit dehydrogenase